MKKKMVFLTIIYMAIIIIIQHYYRIASIVLLIILIIFFIAGISFVILNKLYKQTNHWKNQFLFQKNFISNSGYRSDLSRNFSIVNLGSNPARYGFFYEKVIGQNWATGSQGLSMDFEILKYFHSYVKENGYILIPIMPFTAISQYIKTKSDYWGLSYYSKFASILDVEQIKTLPNYKNILLYLKYPIINNFHLIRYIINDEPVDRSLETSEQLLDAHELEQHSRTLIELWKKEFDVATIEEFYDKRFDKYKKESIHILKDMINFCLERDLNPVLITIPMSSYLSANFTKKFREQMIDNFIETVNVKKIKVINYMFDERFSDASLYGNSFYLNLKGRKAFTKYILKELKLE